jgi:hypothetical protein
MYCGLFRSTQDIAFNNVLSLLGSRYATVTGASNLNRHWRYEAKTRRFQESKCNFSTDSVPLFTTATKFYQLYELFY